ncbi:MAG: glycoside hydrolase family 2 TIM barrel-domain containing protein [Eubacteriales bacterium]|nr:glycoside hydrolase family 2 TIM barrel-domain containing protein [Eubacteriales bacterium]
MKHLETPWTKEACNDKPLPQYPRPLMVREKWINLNGFWDYAITGDQKIPKNFSGKIRVPFSPEARLSGVNQQLKPDETLWYYKSVLLPKDFYQTGEKLILHIGAADQFCCVYVDGKCVGSHSGGYLPFSMDITSMVHYGQPLSILAGIRDASDTSYHSRGKQQLRRGGMFYTAQSGIWQTVWLESVPAQHISSLRITPDYDTASAKIRVCIQGTPHSQDAPCSSVSCEVFAPVHLGAEGVNTSCCEELVTEKEIIPGRETAVTIPHMKAWTPETPWLYPVRIICGKDIVYSYFALRKCNVQIDSQGTPRLFLNNRPYFQTGVLDQGYWPDGLYTAPTDEALIYDIQTMKNLGYNMLRKHAKVEPQRWYFHCDRLGMLVWQDMVNGGTSYHHWFVTYLATLFQFLRFDVKDTHRTILSRRSRLGRQEYVNELREMVRTLYNHPSIVCWVPFNEGWGQFSTKKVTNLLNRLDPNRLVDSASGWFDQGCGDIRSLHYYFFKLRVPRDSRVLALSELGGYSWRIPEHSACPGVYGYQIYHSRDTLTAGYDSLMKETVFPTIKKGMSAIIYTQLSDIEEEVNGILTYDRKKMKFHPLILQKWNAKLKNSLSPQPPV